MRKEFFALKWTLQYKEYVKNILTPQYPPPPPGVKIMKIRAIENLKLRHAPLSFFSYEFVCSALSLVE